MTCCSLTWAKWAGDQHLRSGGIVKASCCWANKWQINCKQIENKLQMYGNSNGNSWATESHWPHFCKAYQHASNKIIRRHKTQCHSTYYNLWFHIIYLRTLLFLSHQLYICTMQNKKSQKQMINLIYFFFCLGVRKKVTNYTTSP